MTEDKMPEPEKENPMGDDIPSPLDRGPDIRLAALERLQRERDEARAESIRLRNELADRARGDLTHHQQVLDVIGNLIQEAKHHHAGKGRPLDGPGDLPLWLAQRLAYLEHLTSGETKR